MSIARRYDGNDWVGELDLDHQEKRLQGLYQPMYQPGVGIVVRTFRPERT
jgi:hypothetical protein